MNPITVNALRADWFDDPAVSAAEYGVLNRLPDATVRAELRREYRRQRFGDRSGLAARIRNGTTRRLLKSAGVRIPR